MTEKRIFDFGTEPPRIWKKGKCIPSPRIRDKTCGQPWH